MKLSINGDPGDRISAYEAGESGDFYLGKKAIESAKFITHLKEGEVLLRLKNKMYVVVQSIDLNYD